MGGKCLAAQLSDTFNFQSELHVFRGHQPSKTGFIMGHEFTGVVEEVGDSVKHFKKGDKIVSPFTLSWLVASAP